MKSIVEAIEAENKYKKDRLDGIDCRPLSESISEYGYDNLEEFFEDKRIYQINQAGIKVYNSSVNEAVNTLQYLIANKICSVLIVNSEQFFVYHGSEEFDKVYCEENNIPVYEVTHMGGTIVGSPGDVSIGIIVPSSIDINSDWVLQKFKFTLSKYFDNVKAEGNDILIDGHKVLGSAIFNTNGMFAFVAHIAFTDSTELIKNICKAGINKIPGYIPEKLSRKLLSEEVISWLL